MKQFILKSFLYLATLIFIIGCNPDIIDPPAAPRKVVASNFVHEDNINGRIINPNINLDTNIIDNFRFVYNTNGTLNSISVFDDSSHLAVLQKEVKFVYYPDKVRWFTFNAADTTKERVYDAFFNAKKQVIRIADSSRIGFDILYTNDKISFIGDTSNTYPFDSSKNFVYNGNNLMQYEIYRNGSILGKAVFEYGQKNVTPEFDIKLYSSEVRFIYIAGLNIINKVGLNFGTGNSNVLLKRIETALPSNALFNEYTFDYEFDRNNTNEIIKRSISNIRSSDTLFYQYKY
ncbi:MAG: hypothetical protein IPF58_16405 [Saprospirales bacterium]|nr:hypothetical protein [Saprospirales bacterium]